MFIFGKYRLYAAEPSGAGGGVGGGTVGLAPAGMAPQGGVVGATETVPEAEGDGSASELLKLKDEAAKRRIEAKQLREQLAALQPLAEEAQRLKEAQMSEQDKLAKQLQTLQAQLAQEKAAAAQAMKEKTFLALATKAQIPAEMVPFLNLGAFDLEDEATALEQMGKVSALLKAAVPAISPTNGMRQSGQNPEQELRQFLFGQRPTIFGG